MCFTALMAQRVVTQLIDDLTGEEIKPGSGESIQFSVDGQNYAIDLTKANADAFREAFAQYVSVATKTSNGRTKAPKRRAGGNTAEVREWARGNGWPDLGDRGRIPADAQAAFESRQ